MSPSATYNALGSLIVPAAILVLYAFMSEEQHRKIVAAILILVALGALLALLQFAGEGYNNPLINDIRGSVSGNFANRNHFALFLSVGCVLLIISTFERKRGTLWIVLAAALLTFFILVLLATGSRTGLLLGLIAVIFASGAVRIQIAQQFKAMPRHASISLVCVIFCAIGAAVTLAVFMDRAVSVDRAYEMDAGFDLRSRIYPVVISISKQYFPVGAGIGTFDPIFRVHEPDAMLQALYYNRAHNDWLEILLDAGLLGGALLLAASGWWAVASYRVWFGSRSTEVLPKAASLIIFLVMLASLTDYPARTPMIMAVLTLAAIWLANKNRA